MKTIFTFINILLITVMAYLCVDMIYKNIMPESFLLPDEHLPDAISNNTSLPAVKPNLSKNQYDVIVTRNLFKVDIEEKEESSQKVETKDQEPEKLEVTNLKLVLWGTVTGDSEVYAVIEDKKVRQQSLYQVGDSIQGAKLKKILRHEVILTYQGKDQVLEMETDRKNVSKSRLGRPVKKTNFNQSPVRKAIIDNPQDNIGVIMKQVKFRPHFTEGEPDGLMVYGIRPNSIFRKMGLRNGDIIKDINGTPIVSAEDASSLFSEIEDADDAKVTLFRRGKVKELFYKVKEDQYATEAVPEPHEKISKGGE